MSWIIGNGGRLRSLIAAITVASTLAVPAVASAGQDDIFAGWLGTTGVYGPRHSLTSVWATWYDGYDACLNALNDDGSGWAGATYCATPSDTNVGHSYCGCKLRKGYAFGNGNQSWGYWRQFW